MKRYFFLISLFVSVHGYAQEHTGWWSEHTVANDSASEAGYLFFADSLAGYAEFSYSDYPLSSTNINRWYSTIDGGVSWTLLPFNGISADLAQRAGIQPVAPSHNSIFIGGSGSPFILRSLDNGNHWDSLENPLDFAQFFTMFTEKKGVGISGTRNSPFVMETTDGAKSYHGMYHDSLFSASLLASLYYSGSSGIQCGFSESLHGIYCIQDMNLNKGNGITSLVTSDGGMAWKKYHSDIPSYENYNLLGAVQYQKHSPNLWLLPGGSFGFPNTYGIGIRNTFYRLQPKFNISYCYSTDYGITWGYDTSYAVKCNAFYGISPGNIWMLLRDKGVETNPPFPSNKIAHTIDFGKTWDVDTTTLTYSNDLGRSDGRAIYFTDENHGWIEAINHNKPYIFKYHPQKNAVVEHRLAQRKQLPVFPLPATNLVNLALPSGFTPFQVQVFDFVGREYLVPYDIQNNTIQIHTDELKSGIWFAIIKHNLGTNGTRFVLQK